MNLSFPALKTSVRAKWAPIVVRPVVGSCEQFVVGILLVSDGVGRVDIVNGLDRLDCLYGDSSRSVKYAIEIAQAHYESESAKLGERIFELSSPPLSGVSLGEVREGEGESVSHIAQSWLESISSLHRRDYLEFSEDSFAATSETPKGSSRERIGDLIFDFVSDRRSGLEKFFSREIRGRSSRQKSHDIRIDFSGSKFVANFGTLNSHAIGHSSNAIKRRLWDLAIERDREKTTLNQRLHELLIQVPTKDDPQLTQRQVDNVNEAIAALEKQADIEDLRLRPLPTVSAIGTRILEAEAQT